MEKAALASVEPLLDSGYTTVGSSVSVSHLAPTPPGMAVSARSRLIALEGGRLVFEVEARDEVERIGQGRHERFGVPRERFLMKAAEKKGMPGAPGKG